MALASLLPRPKNIFETHDEEEEYIAPQPSIPRKTIPPYGHRQGFVPRNPEDFGDGGAFPEIHVAQYPLDMGRKKTASNAVVPLTLDPEGNIKYDSIITRATKDKVFFSKYSDTVEKSLEDEALARPSVEEEIETTEKTQQALQKIVNGKIKAARPAAPVEKQNAPTYIRYTPAQQGESFNSGASTRIIRLVETPKDPLEPPKFKHKKVPKGPASPPPPLMRSPTRKATAQEQADWKIPPCISNWKNPKGYTIPLDKRLAADGRGLQQVQINDGFAKLSDALYVAERKAREEVELRAAIAGRQARKEKEIREERLRKLAQETREQRAGLVGVAPGEFEEETEDDLRARDERERIRDERKKDRERDRRLESLGNKKAKTIRDADRDIGERIALGEQPKTSSSETMFDSRLFNQSQGMDSGFATDDSYNIFTKPLFNGSSASMMYRPKSNADTDVYGGDTIDKLLNTDRFRPDKDFKGVDRTKPSEPRHTPVEFEKDKGKEKEKDQDIFGFEEFFKKAKTGERKLDKIGKTGHLHAASTSGGGRR